MISPDWISTVQSQFRLSGTSLAKFGRLIGQEWAPLQLDLTVGCHGYGEFFVPALYFQGSRPELRRLAFAILAAASLDSGELDLSVNRTSPTRGIRIARVSGGMSGAFHYRMRSVVKQYPWYPQSKRWDPFIELPRFHSMSLPDGPLNHHRYLGMDPDQPHFFVINGHTKGLRRLTRCLLDYANLGESRDFGIALEVEGGFRGVGPLSYEARFELL